MGKVHFHPPMAEWTFVNGSAAIEPTVVGGSATLEVHELVVVEAGTDILYTSIQGPGIDIFARAGVAPILVEGHDGSSGEGWALQLDALFGYRYLYRYDEASDLYDGSEKTHGLAGAVGLETTFWFSRGFGLNLRLLGGVTFPVKQTSTGAWKDEPLPFESFDAPNIVAFREKRLDYSVDIGFDIGVAF